ncbi:MAG: putative lipid II flippase FtsW [Acidobacteriota bacterium]
MARKLTIDKVLFSAFIALSLFGCVMIYSASAVSSAQSGGNPYRYLIKQLAALAMGGLAAFAVYRTDYRKFARPWIAYGVFGASFLLCVGTLFHAPINNARRWIPLGPVMLQPSEMMKIGLALVLASILARKVQSTGDPERAMVASLVFTAGAAGIVLLEPDMGTAVCYVMLCAVLFWLSGVRARFFALGLAGLIPILAAVALSADYRRARLLSFLHPDADRLGAGFQAIQSLIAVGAGGVAGNGLGGGRQKLFFLPYPHTDFIFAIVGEELGFIGAVAVVLCFGVVGWRGLRAARRAPDAFSCYLAAGATALLVVQAAINLSVVLALVPTKGIPLPFVSYGGSSLVASWVAAGLILNVSQHEVTAAEGT